jgi:hypothetical protein
LSVCESSFNPLPRILPNMGFFQFFSTLAVNM